MRTLSKNLPSYSIDISGKRALSLDENGIGSYTEPPPSDSETNGLESAKEPQPSDSPKEEDICVYPEEIANSGDAVGSDFSQVAEEDIPPSPSLTKRGGRRKHR